MYTDDNGIVRFESLDNIAPLQVGLNAAMESISEALDSNVRIWPVANQSEMNALLVERGASPLEPLYVHRADTGDIERNTGSGWEIYPKPVEDTGWIELPHPSGGWGTYNFAVRRIGAVVYYACNTQIGTSTTSNPIAFLPTQFRPGRQIEAPANTNASGGTAGYFRIQTSGEIEASAAARSANNWFRTSGAYPI